VLEVYSMYRRKTFVGPAPALLAIDLYEVVYAGGAQPPAKLAKSHPNSCGEYAYAPSNRRSSCSPAPARPAFLSSIQPATPVRRAGRASSPRPSAIDLR
jgi:maleamate amidohydrolase